MDAVSRAHHSVALQSLQKSACRIDSGRWTCLRSPGGLGSCMAEVHGLQCCSAKLVPGRENMPNHPSQPQQAPALRSTSVYPSGSKAAASRKCCQEQILALQKLSARPDSLARQLRCLDLVSAEYIQAAKSDRQLVQYAPFHVQPPQRLSDSIS